MNPVLFWYCLQFKECVTFKGVVWKRTDEDVEEYMSGKDLKRRSLSTERSRSEGEGEGG